jgi:hypothetical protein
MIHHLNVQDNCPFAQSDADVRVETDHATSRRFFGANSQTTEVLLDVNSSMIFIAKDGYTLGLTFVVGKPDGIKVFDEAGTADHETLEFNYLPVLYQSGESLHLSYVLSPATNLQNAQHLATIINEKAHLEGAIVAPAQVPEVSLPLLAVLIGAVTVVMVAFKVRRRTVAH